MMKHDIASPSSMLVNEECFSRRLGRTSGYREALNLTRGSRIDGDPFLWRRRRRRKREVCSNVPTKNLSIRKIVKKFHFVRGMERKFFWKFKSLDIIFPFQLLKSEIPFIPRRRNRCEKSSAPRPRVTSQFPIHWGRSGRKHYLRDRYEFTSTRADLDLDPGAQGWGMGRRPMRDNTVYLWRPFYGNSFGGLVSIQWSVASIRSGRSTCALRVARCATFHHVCEATACKDLRVTGRSSFKYGRIGGDHDKEGQKRVTNQNFVVM